MGQNPSARGAFRMGPCLPLPRGQRRISHRQSHNQLIPLRHHHPDPIVSEECLHGRGKRWVDIFEVERSPSG